MKTIEWRQGKLRFIDQTQLPAAETYVETADLAELLSAIRELRIRGAPALGAAAAYGVVLGANTIATTDIADFRRQLDDAIAAIAATRPTARNLFWALERMHRVASAAADPEAAKRFLLIEAENIAAEDEANNRRLGEHGAALIEDGTTVLTHCNAGALACVSYGTALGVLRAAWAQGKRFAVFADETRPLLQGARLTTWELQREGIPVTLITDGMAGYFMRRGEIGCVIVGADRIAANGDVVNKIGTYQVAVLAMENGVPFYVAAPTSTIDLAVACGDDVPIEERAPTEVTQLGGVAIAPSGVAARNPAFDVTPHQYVTAIVTERGIVGEPYTSKLAELLT